MYRHISILFLLIFLWAATTAYAQGPDYQKGELLVMLKPGTDEISMLAESRFSEMNVRIRQHFPNLGVWLIAYEDHTRSDLDVQDRFREDPRIRAVQFNHRIQLRSNPPNDTYFGNQWSLHNNGQTGGTPGADVSALAAWDISTGASGTTVLNDEIITAIVDVGFNLDHEDMNFTDLVYSINQLNQGSTSPNNMPANEHGPIVAGVIGAIGNNSTGIAGIGWNNKVFPVGITGVVLEATAISAYEYILELRKEYNQSNGQQGMFIVATNSSIGIDFANPQNHQVWCESYDLMGLHGILSVAATANENVNIDQVSDMPTACSSDYLISVTNTDQDDNKYITGDPYLNGAAWGATTIDLGAPGTRIYATLLSGGYGIDYGCCQFTSGTSLAAPHVTGTIPLIYTILPEDLLTYYKNYPAQAALDIKDAILNSVDPNASLQGATPTVTGGRLNVFNALKYIIEHHGANLGTGMNEVVFTDEMTIQNPGTKLTLNSNLVLQNDLNLALGAGLTVEAQSTVTISAIGGIVTIGAPGPGSKVAGEGQVLVRAGLHHTDSDPEPRPEQFLLLPNYPNPFNPSTTIRFELPVISDVRLEVYDMLGRRVALLVNGTRQAGTHQAVFDASALSSGVYIYRLQAGGLVQTRKMLLIK